MTAMIFLGKVLKNMLVVLNFKKIGKKTFNNYITVIIITNLISYNVKLVFFVCALWKKRYLKNIRNVNLHTYYCVVQYINSQVISYL